MKKVVYSAVLLAAVVVSCKKETQVDKLPTIPAVSSNVEVTLDILVEEDDKFQLFYTEDGSIDFNGEKLVSASVTGQDKSQTVTFALPNDAKPNNLRLDLGERADQEEMKLNSFTLKFNDKKFKISGQAFLEYFRTNGNLVVDAEKGLMKPTELSGAPYDPMFYPNQILTDTLTKIVK